MSKKAEAKKEQNFTAKAVYGRLGYYRNKELLFIEAFSQEWRESLSHIKRIAGQDLNPYERLLLYIRSFLRYYQEVVTQPTISIRVLIETPVTYKKLFRELRAKESNYNASVLKEGISSGTLLTCEAERVGYSIMIVNDLPVRGVPAGRFP